MAHRNGTDRQRLESWKEIAAHLGVGLRTAQQWESKRGLPVHRLPGGGRGAVYAEIAELDAWRSPGRRQQWILWRVLAGTSALLLLAAVVFLWTRPGVPAEYNVQDQSVSVRDARGREIWRHTFPDGIESSALYRFAGGRRKSLLVDLDADGRQEFLFAHWPTELVNRGSTLFCFSPEGAEKWRFIPGRAVQSRNDRFSPSFRIHAVAVTRANPPRIVVASGHNVHDPGQIAVLSTEGKLLREYWHRGVFFLTEVADLNGDRRDEIITAGVNNPQGSATVIVLDPERLGGAAAEPDHPEAELTGFGPPHGEIARLFLPRSCINKAQERPYSMPVGLVAQGGEILVSTNEGDLEPHSALAFYSLDFTLRPTRVTLADSYRTVHRLLEKRGVLVHTFHESEAEALRTAIALPASTPRRSAGFASRIAD